jgi:uncharacterized caspase-like protein
MQWKEVFVMRRNAAPFWLSFTLLFLMLPAAAMSQRRTALVIGNATYEREPLRTPVNDATDMAKILEQLGFVVSLLHNVPQQAMEEALVVFGQQLRKNDLGFFYFAGRGVHVHGEHYLIPIGASITSAQDVQQQALPLRCLLGVVEAVSPTPVVLVLATSRDNPFLLSGQPRQQALVMAPTTQNVWIAYATAPGHMALEGTGRNSIYTKHLLQHITTPGLSLEEIFRHVRRAVMQETEGKQVSWEAFSLPKDFSLGRKPE